MVTDLKTMLVMNGPKEVKLSGWNDDEITVKLRRPSLYEMAASGRIPNPLLGVADALFMGNAQNIGKASLEDTAKTLRIMAKAALVEPTMAELEENGIELTDRQYNEIYAFIIGGAAQLEKFRYIERNTAGGHGQSDGVQSVEPAGH